LQINGPNQTAATFFQSSGLFLTGDESAYRAWREQKLACYPASVKDILVDVADLARVTPAEHDAIVAACGRANMAIYRAPPTDEGATRAALRAFGDRFGLRAVEDHRSAGADGIVSIEPVESGGRLGYIPYTDRPIAWHTDGYYNFHGPGHCVQAMLLHCVRDAPDGGENRLLDPEIAYIRLRDRDPALIAALTAPDAMTIPANVETDGRVRAENVGPVFFVDPSGALGMRYTARTRSIAWRDDGATRRAADALKEILADDPMTLRVRMRPGEGLICNNVLHDRSGFASSGQDRRLLYRIRYHGRIDAPKGA
jgi:alpha-ketoglutarate-dependent taurine dioxygenase